MSRNDQIMSQFERLESKNKRNSKIMNFRLGIGEGQYLRAFPKHEGENLHTSIILEMNNPLQLNGELATNVSRRLFLEKKT